MADEFYSICILLEFGWIFTIPTHTILIWSVRFLDEESKIGRKSPEIPRPPYPPTTTELIRIRIHTHTHT